MDFGTPSQKVNPITTHTMVVSPHYLATQAGLAVLHKGGNAIESAIAVAATLAVVYPHMCTLGGDSFWLIFSAKDKSLHGINASGRAAESATCEWYTERGLSAIPYKGYLSALTVPGMVSGLDCAYRLSKTFGGCCSLYDLFSAALCYAEEGCPASPSFVKYSEWALSRHAKDPDAYPIYDEFSRIFLNNGSAYRIGEIVRQRDLAKSLRLLIDEGLSSLYTGTLADMIVSDIQENQGLLSQHDFASHRADFVEPIHVPYRGYTAYNLPPNSQGMASLEILSILNNFSVSEIEPFSSKYYHLVVEATKLAFQDRDTYLSDPSFADIPLDLLLSASYAEKKALQIDFSHAMPYTKTMDPQGDTVWFGVVDDFGNAVSCIQSVYHDFGSGIVPKGTGIILQNRGCYFSLDPNHVNCLAPRKRTFHTLNPAMLVQNGSPFLVYGTMGGEGQPQTQAAIVTRIVDFGMRPQEALYAPRWIFGRSFGDFSNALTVESRIPDTVCRELEAMGHSLRKTEAFSDSMGHAGAIVLRNSCLEGAFDVRSDGLAAGY